MGPRDTAISGLTPVTWRAPARCCNCWMQSVCIQKRLRPQPMLPPLGDTGFGPLMLMSVWQKSSASPKLETPIAESSDVELVEQGVVCGIDAGYAVTRMA